jgi:hypothetical protein
VLVLPEIGQLATRPIPHMSNASGGAFSYNQYTTVCSAGSPNPAEPGGSGNRQECLGAYTYLDRRIQANIGELAIPFERSSRVLEEVWR